MTKEYKIKNEDWRLQGVTTIKKPSRGMKAEPGDVIKVCALTTYKENEIALGIPRAVALFLDIAFISFKDIAEMREAAVAKRDKCYIPDASAFSYFERVMTSIIFSYTALESFANEEIPEGYIHHQKTRGIFAALFKPTIERRVDLDTKLGDILPQVTQIISPKGTSLWTDYLRLKEDRNRIIHLKSHDRRAPYQGPPSIWERFFSPDLPHYPEIAKNMIAYFQKDRDESRVPRWFKLLPF